MTQESDSVADFCLYFLIDFCEESFQHFDAGIEKMLNYIGKRQCGRFMLILILCEKFSTFWLQF